MEENRKKNQKNRWVIFVIFSNIPSSPAFLPSPKCTFKTHVAPTLCYSDILYHNFLDCKLFMLVLHDAKTFWRVLHRDQRVVMLPQEQTQNTDNGQITSAVMVFRIFWFDLYSLIRQNSDWSASEHKAVDWLFPLQKGPCFKFSVIGPDNIRYKFSSSRFKNSLHLCLGHTWRGNNLYQTLVGLFFFFLLHIWIQILCL